MKPILDSALEYGRRGWRVFPLGGPDGKKPLIDKWPDRATSNEEKIKMLWKQFPKANIGIATGGDSGIFVVDIDGDTGALSLLDLELAHGKLPATYRVETARGYHLYYIQPPGIETKNQASGELGNKIDIRGDGGYVVAPPSVHLVTGKIYEVSDARIPVVAPDWLLEAVLRHKKKRSEMGEHLVPAKIEKGSRDVKMTRIAGQLRWLGLETEEMLRAMLEVNLQRFKPPMEESDVVRIAKSIGQKEPGRCSPTGQINESNFVSYRADQVRAMPVTWRWPGFLPRGTIVAWGGDPGHGKSTMAYTIAAGVTRGDSLPGDDTGDRYGPEHVLILSAEDSRETTIIPRLIAAKADLQMITIIDVLMSNGKPAEFPLNLVQLVEKISETEAKLVIIDPLESFLGQEVDSHKTADVRRTIAPIHAIAERTGCTILTIGHLNKSSTAGAMQRFSGSGAFVAAPRAAFAFGSSAEFEGEHIFACVKINLAQKPAALRYVLEGVDLNGLGSVAKISWRGESKSETADSILAQPANGEGKTAKDNAVEFLKEFLAEGPKPAKEVKREAFDVGISWPTLRRAQTQMEIKIEQRNRQFFWMLKGFNWQKKLETEDGEEI